LVRKLISPSSRTNSETLARTDFKNGTVACKNHSKQLKAVSNSQSSRVRVLASKVSSKSVVSNNRLPKIINDLRFTTYTYSLAREKVVVRKISKNKRRSLHCYVNVSKNRRRSIGGIGWADIQAVCPGLDEKRCGNPNE
jgi:hypothetical protein